MKRSNFNTFTICVGGYYKERRQALGLSPRLPKGGQRYRLIGGDSYGC